MSELIAEARVLVRPDTTGFREALAAEVTKAARGVTVPVAVTPSFSGAAISAGLAGVQQQIASSAQAATGALRLEQLLLSRGAVDLTAFAQGAREMGSAVEGADDRLKKLGDSSRRAGAGLQQVAKGSATAGLSFLGLRGATLAAGGAFLTGAAAITLFGRSIGAATALETSLNTFRVTADATASEMERISDVAKELGADLTLPGVTANSAAEALSQLSRAGLSVEDSVDGVRGTLQLATAAAIDNEQAVLLVAGALNAFQLAGEDASRVADLLAASSKESQGSIVDMGLSLQQSAAAAAQAGVSVEDTIALLTQLGRAGLRGSDAGTSLRVALLRLIAPSKQAKEALEGLGVAVRDEAGNVRPEAFAEITDQLSLLGKAQRDATLALIFGQDAFRAASIIGREGAVGLREMREATQEVGVASELASARTQGLAGSAENLRNQFQTLGLTIGGAASGPLKTFVDTVAQSVSGINSFIGFIGRIGDETPLAEQSVSDLADEFQRLNEEAGGGVTHDEAVRRVQELGRAASVTVLEYAELTKEAGRANAEVARGTEKGFVSRAAQNELERLNDELRAAQSEGVKATDVIEGFRLGMDAAADSAEGLRNRLDETLDRFAQPLPEPTVAAPSRQRVSQREGQAALAQSEGDLRETERIQEQILENAIRAERTGIRKSVEARQRLFDDRVAAQTNLNNTRKQIAARQEADSRAAAADAKRAADAEAARLQAADQAVLEAQQDSRRRQERLVGLAGETEGLQDDIRRRQGLRALITQQIKEIRTSVQDEDTKQEAIKALAAAKQATSDDINRLVREQAEQSRALREAAQEERESAQIALAESILDLTGNKNPLLRALDAATRDAIRQRNAAKKGSVEFVKAQTEINNLLLRRKELLEEAKQEADGQQGLSAFDILRQNAETFQRTGGNLVTGNQPFAGSAGFTADVAQFLTRGKPTIEVVAKPDTSADARERRFQGGIDRLVEALERNTEAREGRAGRTVRGVIDRNDRAHFDEATQARRVVERRSGI